VQRSQGTLGEEGLFEFYRDHATRVLLPFWMNRALDEINGGVYTCFNNEGTKLVSRDKYTWSQGRFVWVLSRLASLCNRGVLEEDARRCLEHAGKTVEFLRDHAILENGNCAFLVSETGEKKESVPGQGFDTSFYADCFVVLGFSEYARVALDAEVLEEALGLYDRIVARLRSGDARSEPYPIPEGYEPHAVPMIMLNTSWELANALRCAEHPRASDLETRGLAYAAEIMKKFCLEDSTIAEMLPQDDSASDTILARHLNPGHALESMWFVMEAAAGAGRQDLVQDAVPAIRRAFELGWDAEQEGLLRFVDRDGGTPKGREIGHPYERLILETWDTKLWWPHSEALYATLLAADLAKDESLLQLYTMVHTYTFRTFPHPDDEVGEWIQIRDRGGRPVDKMVALPVKDPYHALRSSLLILELLHDKQKGRCQS
jgi:N-acylglucosamine 2-epimerase